MNKLYMVLIVPMFMLYLVSAESFVFQQNVEVNYRFRCLDTNTNYCNSATICVINIEDPRGINVYDNSSMTWNETFFNHTLPTVQIGEYSSIIKCNGVNGTISEFQYKVTPTGDVRGFGIFIVLILSGLSCFLIAAVLRLEWLGFLSGLLFLITGIYSMIYGIGDLADLYTRTVAFISIGLGMVFIIASAWAFTHSTED